MVLVATPKHAQYALLLHHSRHRRDRSSLPHLPTDRRLAGQPAGHGLRSRSTAASVSATSTLRYFRAYTYICTTRSDSSWSPADQHRLHPPFKAFSMPKTPDFGQSHASSALALPCPNAQIAQARSSSGYTGPGPPRLHDRHKPRPAPASTSSSKNCIITWYTKSGYWPSNLSSWYRNSFPVQEQNNPHIHACIHTYRKRPQQNASFFCPPFPYLVLSALGASSSAENDCC